MVTTNKKNFLFKVNDFYFLGLKVTQQSWLLLFAFSPSLFFRFSCVIFFSIAGHLTGFILVRRVFRKAFRILGLGERKGRWVVEQDFHGNFRVSVTWFVAFFSSVLDWIVLILVWFERSLHSAHISGQSCPWTSKLMASQAVEGTWICTGGYGRSCWNTDHADCADCVDWVLFFYLYINFLVKFLLWFPASSHYLHCASPPYVHWCVPARVISRKWENHGLMFTGRCKSSFACF